MAMHFLIMWAVFFRAGSPSRLLFWLGALQTRRGDLDIEHTSSERRARLERDCLVMLFTRLTPHRRDGNCRVRNRHSSTFA